MTHELPAVMQSTQNHDSHRPEINFNVRKFVFMTVLATFVLHSFLVDRIKREYFDGIRNIFKSSAPAGKSYSRPEIISANFDQMPDSEFDSLSSKIANSYGPDEIYDLYGNLLQDNKNPRSNKFAVHVLEKGALRYKTSKLLLRAGLEFSLGRFVNRDYVKATGYLTDPILKNNQFARYYLALIYLAPDNPSLNQVRGLEILNQLAESGFAAAQKNLRLRQSAN